MVAVISAGTTMTTMAAATNPAIIGRWAEVAIPNHTGGGTCREVTRRILERGTAWAASRIASTGCSHGSWGRPDMAPLLFSRAILAGRPIEVFNHGQMRRDFTHISDIVAGILGALAHPADGDTPHQVFNLGNHTPVALEYFIAVIEKAAGRTAEKIHKPMQPGDMVVTCADTRKAETAFGFAPSTPIETGLPPVVAWCRDYFGDAA